MRRILEAAGQELPDSEPILEVIHPMDWLSEWMESRMKIASPISR